MCGCGERERESEPGRERTGEDRFMVKVRGVACTNVLEGVSVGFGWDCWGSVLVQHPGGVAVTAVTAALAECVTDRE